MSAPTLADFFTCVSVSKWKQALHLEVYPVGYNTVDANNVTTFNPTAYIRDLYTGEFEERQYSFVGVPASIYNNLPASVDISKGGTVTDRVYFTPNFVDGSTGNAIIEKDVNRVEILRFSPHLRTIIVTRRVCRLLRNNTQVFPAPSFTS